MFFSNHVSLTSSTIKQAEGWIQLKLGFFSGKQDERIEVMGGWQCTAEGYK